MDMDYGKLFGEARGASDAQAGAVERLPSELETLRKNLNQVYQQDNPLIQQREGLLQNYFSAGDTARANLLSGSASGGAFSPTQLNALVSQTQGANLAPLTTLNNLIIGQYGGLQDLVSKGGNIANALIQGAGIRSDSLFRLAQAAQAQAQFEKQMELQREQIEAQKAAQRYVSVGTNGLYDTQSGTYLSGSSVWS